ncbi:MXAN_6640 family putative metalloprotease [Nocardioides jiangxiensis]|uniref:DUF6055 domain-containing protein n=1 Tax=Nocardioides jiangxiensis TaxID=3064524 RepID=A0ABT9AXU2_9ACTN|nr:MXAN_6640 family putative metalloprotease [Nocardioides sp. WY-20]MDO7867381.1 DUF6055 domain-containing protein [Nocardioides sp. WY-20]
MRTRPLITAVAAASLALAVTPALSGAAAAAPTTPGTPPASSAPVAQKALDEVAALLAAHQAGTGASDEASDLTLALLDLRKHLPQLDAADRRQARALLARPDGSASATADPTAARWTGDERTQARSTCDDTATYGDNPFCVHWVPRYHADGTTLTTNGSGAASRQYSTLDAVRKTVDEMKLVWNSEITQMGYAAPPGDGHLGESGLLSPSNRLDVYLADAGAAGVYGYAVPETDNVSSYGYLVLDNDFSLQQFPSSTTTSDEAREVTTAHEFFHLVQFGYDSWENAWLMESTATWMEEQVHDDVDDNRQFIPAGSEKWPAKPLDTFDSAGAQYGTWVFHQLVTEHLGTAVVRHVWEYAAQGPTPTATQDPYVVRDNARWALNAALTDAGSSLFREFRAFSAGGIAPSRFWSEGSAFPYASITRSWALGIDARSIPSGSVTVDHLAGADFKFTPKSGLDSTWRIGIKVDAPNHGGTAYALVIWTDGHVTRTPIDLDSTGYARRVLPFSSASIRTIGLAVANAGTGEDMKISLAASIFRS